MEVTLQFPVLQAFLTAQDPFGIIFFSYLRSYKEQFFLFLQVSSTSRTVTYFFQMFVLCNLHWLLSGAARASTPHYLLCFCFYFYFFSFSFVSPSKAQWLLLDYCLRFGILTSWFPLHSTQCPEGLCPHLRSPLTLTQLLDKLQASVSCSSAKRESRVRSSDSPLSSCCSHFVDQQSLSKYLKICFILVAFSLPITNILVHIPVTSKQSILPLSGPHSYG